MRMTACSLYTNSEQAAEVVERYISARASETPQRLVSCGDPRIDFVSLA